MRPTVLTLLRNSRAALWAALLSLALLQAAAAGHNSQHVVEDLGESCEFCLKLDKSKGPLIGGGSDAPLPNAVRTPVRVSEGIEPQAPRTSARVRAPPFYLTLRSSKLNACRIGRHSSVVVRYERTVTMKTRYSAVGATAVGCLVCSAALADDRDISHEHDQDVHFPLDEIIVSAAPLERTVEQLAQPTSVLSGDQLASSQGSSIGETVANQPGVSASYFGPVASRPVIRGQFGERVRILTNGLDSLDASALSEDHAVGLDSILADRIEIVRGPATLLYGSGASGGLVNIVDSRILTGAPSAGLSGGVALGTGLGCRKGLWCLPPRLRYRVGKPAPRLLHARHRKRGNTGVRRIRAAACARRRRA